MEEHSELENIRFDLISSDSNVDEKNGGNELAMKLLQMQREKINRHVYNEIKPGKFDFKFTRKPGKWHTIRVPTKINHFCTKVTPKSASSKTILYFLRRLWNPLKNSLTIDGHNHLLKTNYIRRCLSHVSFRGKRKYKCKIHIHRKNKKNPKYMHQVSTQDKRIENPLFNFLMKPKNNEIWKQDKELKSEFSKLSKKHLKLRQQVLVNQLVENQSLMLERKIEELLKSKKEMNESMKCLKKSENKLKSLIAEKSSFYDNEKQKNETESQSLKKELNLIEDDVSNMLTDVTILRKREINHKELWKRNYELLEKVQTLRFQNMELVQESKNLDASKERLKLIFSQKLELESVERDINNFESQIKFTCCEISFLNSKIKDFRNCRSKESTISSKISRVKMMLLTENQNLKVAIRSSNTDDKDDKVKSELEIVEKELEKSVLMEEDLMKEYNNLYSELSVAESAKN